MVHEIGHNLGMNHEQKRPDAQATYMGQGPYLRMFWQNVPAQWVPQYTPDDQSYIGSANDGTGDVHSGYAQYDYGSIMHYPPGNRFETIDPTGMNLVGNRQKLSAGDIEQVMDMYNCRTKGGGGATAAPITTGAPQTPAPATTTPKPTTTPSTVGTTLDPSKFLSAFSCDFESTWCSFTRYAIDPQTGAATTGGAWRRDAGGTPSSGTGPVIDHTKGTSGGFYAYVEASSPNFPSKTFTLESSVATLSGTGKLNFWYHMFGVAMGTLTLQAKTPTSSWTPLWTKAGSQQTTQTSAWLQASVTITPNYNQIRFVGTTAAGTAWSGDMAIDDLVFVYDAAVATTTPAPPATTTTPRGGGGGPNVIDCNFEAGTCSWTETTLPVPQGDGSAWTRRSGGTPSSGTGPTGDHTTGAGYYMYVEASSPNYPSKTFTLTTPIMALASSGTISFYYHMSGTLVGDLALQYKDVQGTWRTLWDKTGAQQPNQNDPWKKAMTDAQQPITVPQSAIQLQFVGTTAGSWSGDMAIDDIVFTAGGVVPTTTTPLPTTTTPVTTTTLPPGYKCEATCSTATGGWWQVTGTSQCMPKCAWWSCNGCSECLSPTSKPASKCIPWCYAQPFGGWKVHLHTCAVFDACSDCSFCGGTIASDMDAGDIGPGANGGAGDDPGDEPGNKTATSGTGNGGTGLGQINASPRPFQTLWLAVGAVSCLIMMI